MKAKRKLIVSMLALVFVLLAVVATVAITFALTQQTIKTTLNISYTAEDIDGTVSATFTLGGVTENLTAKKGDTVIGDKLVFKAGDTEDAGNLMFPNDALALSSTNDNVVIQYTYSNTGDKHYIASMDFAAKLEPQNMKVEYSIDGTTYSTQRYAVVVPANTSNRSYWIRISIDNKAKNASFTGDFNWLLSGCDPQSKEYLSLTSVEMQATGITGAYSVSFAEGSEYVGNIVFPSEVNGSPVTTIAQNSSLTQDQKNQVTRVYIPDSVTTIGDSAFNNYQNLQTVTFEQNEEASSASVQSETGLTGIGNSAFRNCISLTSIEIPNTVTSIEWYAFSDCTGLTSIEIPNTVTSIEMYAFSGCSGLTSIEIPASVTIIENGAFSGCSGLTSIIVASGNTTYHSAGNCIIETASKILVLGCKTSVIPTDDSVTSIGGSAFWGCSGLTSIVIPDSVIRIKNGERYRGAFWGCSGLTSIVIPASVTRIEWYAFSGCSGLTSVTFKSRVGWEATSFMDGGPYQIEEAELTDPANAAELLKGTYYNCTWIRS